SVINYFNKHNIKTLDALIITHNHDDHNGEALDILSNLDVKMLVVNSILTSYGDYSQIVLREKDELKFGDITLVNLNEFHDENENNNSLTLYGKIGNDYWLFTGDIEKAVEEEIINKYDLKIDVLKVAHHGSKTSSTKNFINKIKPDNAIISVGLNNYNHPDKDVIKELTDNRINVFRTDMSGSVMFYYSPFLNISIVETYLLGEKPKYHLNN
ncbi:MAG: MBL fold metallo-hydrolase, partial [Candidatus Izemoplasmatales bacterium]